MDALGGTCTNLHTAALPAVMPGIVGARLPGHLESTVGQDPTPGQHETTPSATDLSTGGRSLHLAPGDFMVDVMLTTVMLGVYGTLASYGIVRIELYQ